MRSIALILRRPARAVSKDEGVSSALWTLLRDAVLSLSNGRLLRMRDVGVRPHAEATRRGLLRRSTPAAAR